MFQLRLKILGSYYVCLKINTGYLVWLYLGNVTKHWSTREGNSYFKTQNQTKPMGLYKQQPVPASEYYQILTLTIRHFKQGMYTAQSERGHPVTLSEK